MPGALIAGAFPTSSGIQSFSSPAAQSAAVLDSMSLQFIHQFAVNS
jgi:hypothetical protein